MSRWRWLCDHCAVKGSQDTYSAAVEAATEHGRGIHRAYFMFSTKMGLFGRKEWHYSCGWCEHVLSGEKNKAAMFVRIADHLAVHTGDVTRKALER